MRYMITGVAGFIGSHLCEELLRLGHEVVGVDCFTPYYDPILKRMNISRFSESSRFTLLEQNVVTLTSNMLLDIDGVFHLAGQPGVRPSWGQEFDIYLKHNVRATQHVLELLREFPGKRVVYASSSSVYGNAGVEMLREDLVCSPHSPYGVTKLAGEHLVMLYSKNFGVHGTALRFFTVYGPRQRPDMAFHRFIMSALSNEPITVYGDGRQKRDFTYVLDLVQALVAAMSSPAANGQVMNIGGGCTHELMNALELIQSETGMRLNLVHSARQFGDVDSTSADISKAGRLLGYSPKFTLREGISAQVRALRRV